MQKLLDFYVVTQMVRKSCKGEGIEKKMALLRTTENYGIKQKRPTTDRVPWFLTLASGGYSGRFQLWEAANATNDW